MVKDVSARLCEWFSLAVERSIPAGQVEIKFLWAVLSLGAFRPKGSEQIFARQVVT